MNDDGRGGPAGIGRWYCLVCRWNLCELISKLQSLVPPARIIMVVNYYYISRYLIQFKSTGWMGVCNANGNRDF